jgi:hypothetical protein
MSSKIPTSSFGLTPNILRNTSITFSILSIIIFITYIVKILNVEENTNYKDKLLGKIILISIGFLLMFFSAIMCMMENPSYAIYILVLITSLSIGISYACFSITLASKL